MLVDSSEPPSWQGKNTYTRLPKAYASVQDAKTVVHNTRALAQSLKHSRTSCSSPKLSALWAGCRASTARSRLLPSRFMSPTSCCTSVQVETSRRRRDQIKAGLRRCEKNGRIFQKISKPPRHAAAATPDNSHAAAATPEQPPRRRRDARIALRYGSPVRENAGPPVEDRRERRPHGVLRRLHGPRHEPHVRAVPGGDERCGNQISGT